MMIYVEAPAEMEIRGEALFLAGGISECPDWQSEAVRMLRYTPYTVLNPRRKAFLEESRVAKAEQVAWEYCGLRMANVIAFWFPPTGVQPVALYELGAAVAAGKPISVGAHPRYCRRLDIELQLEVAHVTDGVYDTLEDTVGSACRLLRAAQP
jgi:Nucleoside 2-deoxyribosyltransferase like